MLTELASQLANGTIRVVDLTNKLSAETPALVLPEPFKNLIDFSLEKVAAYDEYAPFWAHNNIHMGEHVGTHLDAPCHWASGREGLDVSQIDPARLVGPAVVMDFSAEAARDADWCLDVHHVEAWLAEHGPLAENSWLLLRTGWDQYSHDGEKFRNVGADGNSHTPGVTAACAEYLAQLPNLSGFGVETVGIDAGNAGSFDPPFPVHYHLLGANRYGITSLQNLDQLPATGAVIVVAPLPIVGGTGAPARVYALVEG